LSDSAGPGWTGSQDPVSGPGEKKRKKSMRKKLGRGRKKRIRKVKSSFQSGAHDGLSGPPSFA